MTVQLLADRLRGVESSPTLALAAKAKALLKAGKPVLDFTAGEPDFPTPAAIKQAAIQAIQNNRTKYTPVSGIPELRSAIAASFHRTLGVSYEAAQIIVSCGAKHALYNALQVLCQPGDEVIILTPFWVSYTALVQLTGATPILVETRESENYQPDPDTIRAKITPRTKAMIVNTPSNPTGMLIERARLAAIAALAIKHGVTIISDEIYDQLVFPPHRPCSIVQADANAIAQTIIVNGVSKTYSMTGWRIGYAAGPKPLIEAMGVLQSHSTSNPTSISQDAALAALTGEHPEIAIMTREFQRRRDRLVNGLNQIPGLSCLMPEGAFYAWCNIVGRHESASTIASRLLEEALIAVIPGEGFGSPNHLRFSFATSMDAIDQALERLAQWAH